MNSNNVHSIIDEKLKLGSELNGLKMKNIVQNKNKNILSDQINKLSNEKEKIKEQNYPKLVQLNGFEIPIFREECQYCKLGVSRVDFKNLLMETEWKDFPLIYCIIYTNKKYPFHLKEEKMMDDAMKEFHRLGICKKVVFVIGQCYVENQIFKRDQLWAHLNLALNNHKLGIPYYLVFEIRFETKILSSKIDLEIGNLLYDIPWTNTFGISLSTECFLNQISNQNYSKMWPTSIINNDISCLILTKNFMNFVSNQCKTLVKIMKKSYSQYSRDYMDLESQWVKNITEEPFLQYIPKNDNCFNLENVLSQGTMYQTCNAYFGWKPIESKESIFTLSKSVPKYIYWIRKYNHHLSAILTSLISLSIVIFIALVLKFAFSYI